MSSLRDQLIIKSSNKLSWYQIKCISSWLVMRISYLIPSLLVVVLCSKLLNAWPPCSLEFWTKHSNIQITKQISLYMVTPNIYETLNLPWQFEISWREVLNSSSTSAQRFDFAVNLHGIDSQTDFEVQRVWNWRECW